MDPVHNLTNAAAPDRHPPASMDVPAASPGLPPVFSPALSPGSLPRPDDMPSRPPLYSPASSVPHLGSPPPRKDTTSSVSTQATSATLASTETSSSSYSADTSQSIFSMTDGSDVSNTRRASRRRTGPLSQQSRERAALIRKLGACTDCRRRRVAVRWPAFLCV